METVWEGPEVLRPFLVAVDELEPFPGNPRRGDVAVISDSLKRFGQVKAIVTNGARIVAGNHLRQAAVELGWTHIAAIENEFASEEEARAYLLADNRTHDLGPGYDPQLLVEHLQYLDEFSTIYGTGYSHEDMDQLQADLLRMDSMVSPSTPAGAKLDLVEVVLVFSQEQHRQFAEWIETAATRHGTDGLSETAYEALRLAAGA